MSLREQCGQAMKSGSTSPPRVKELYGDIGSREKIFVDLACSSHNAMWERNHTLLFRASLEWLTQGTVNGAKDGMLRLGYDAEP